MVDLLAVASATAAEGDRRAGPGGRRPHQAGPATHPGRRRPGRQRPRRGSRPDRRAADGPLRQGETDEGLDVAQPIVVGGVLVVIPRRGPV